MKDAPFLLEDFRPGRPIDPRLMWSNLPATATACDRGLLLETAGNTDLWQRTHYGFCRDNAHELCAELNGDFELETSVHFEPVHQYDQAGLIVRLSAACWLKTSIEFERDGPSRLGSVVTNAAFSDWATQDVAPSTRAARFRIRRHSGDYIVEYGGAEGTWSQIRVAHLHEDDGTRPIRAGIYACSPKEPGFRATFDFLRVTVDA